MIDDLLDGLGEVVGAAVGGAVELAGEVVGGAIDVVGDILDGAGEASAGEEEENRKKGARPE